MDTTIAISTTTIITILLGIVSWFIKKMIQQQEETNAKNELMTDRILLSIDALRDTIAEIKTAISTINTNCQLKHDVINSRLKDLESDSIDLNDNIKKVEIDVVLIKNKTDKL